MDVQMQQFGKRLDRITRRHDKLANGFVTVVNSDGLLVAHPRRQNVRFPWRLTAVVAVLFFALKGLLMAGLGAEEYNVRATSLQAGTPVEQIGGWAMQQDPVSAWIASQLAGYL